MRRLFILAFIFIGASTALADEHATEMFEAKVIETTHKGKFNDTRIDYKVIAGGTVLKDKEGKQKANIFSTAYIADTSDKNRPLIFVFNGGPGSSSVWLHMGVFGPKLVEIPSEAEPVPSAPFTIKENIHSLLDVADLVFIDPVGTGYSKALGEYEGKDFWGVRQDAQSLAEFIRIFITRHQRWNSEKYLAGESYGTTRAALMVKELQEGWGSIDLSGVFLISAILDFQTGDFGPGNDLPYVTFLPTYAATAWYHNKIENKDRWQNDLNIFLSDVREFALKQYAPALMLGDTIADDTKTQIIDKLHAFTGLSTQYIGLSNLRINEFMFMKELLRDKGFSVGRLDSRYRGEDAVKVSDRFEADPSSYAIDGAYTAALQHYFATELDVQREDKYEILSGDVFSNWDWLYEQSPRSQGFLNTSQHLSKGQRQNPSFRIFVANGYYDLATPFFATEYSMMHAGIDKSRLTMKYYPAGHMMYIHHPSLAQLADDMRAFIKSSDK